VSHLSHFSLKTAKSETRLFYPKTARFSLIRAYPQLTRLYPLAAQSLPLKDGSEHEWGALISIKATSI
jgi:hypothetical protein